MRKDVLAAGAHKATFVTGGNSVDAPVELKNVSTEARNEFAPVEIDRTRKVRRIVPKGDNILVSRRESEDISAGGILIPDTIKDTDKPAEGVIIAAGKYVEDLKEGDHIIFGRYSGTEYPFGGETLLFMREEEVIAVVED